MVWGKPYKYVFSKRGASSDTLPPLKAEHGVTTNTLDKINLLSNKFFPRDTTEGETAFHAKLRMARAIVLASRAGCDTGEGGACCHRGHS